MSTKHQKDTQPPAAQVGAYITLPFVLAIPPLLGALIGKGLDTLFHTTPILMYVILLLGICAGIREFWRILKKFGENGDV